ncbi:type II secretion system F family protein [Arthrobacter sp. SLBN-122]|uniref:type II secretion system F family protein n=1 Tax=Arthrobacter sp. SLBN-122 TaxID=2768455 RepID=UPI00115256A0|nr:type II secretion system F family protein [Arthrobacter sp. SLBN-122]TQJ33290.1 tight adherence protein B [Arthrobacter sp. SLBN-122]
MPTHEIFVAGILLIGASFATAVLVVFKPANGSLPLSRRRPLGAPEQTAIGRFASSVVQLVDRALAGKKTTTVSSNSLLSLAGISLPQADFVVLVVAATMVAGFAGLVLQGIGLGLLLVVAVPVVARVALSILVQRRRAAFEAQLGDTLTMVSGGLRAGHSVLRAIDAVAQEASEPTASEFSRVVNETRLGRDLQDSLNEVSLRMKSEDFSWMAQAIEINREVGGDLAEVFDQVAETIRERTQIKGTVKALSAEGKLSAIILMALPVLLFILIGLANPKYMGALTGHPVGWMLLGVAAVMMTIGGIWVHKISDLKF